MPTEVLTEAESAKVLREANSGVLALTNGEETYAVPQSFGYDGTALYFQLVYTEDSDKMAFIETTDMATLTVYTESPAISVIVRGELKPVPEAEEAVALDVLAENAMIPTLNVSPEASTADLSFKCYRLTPAHISGQEVGSSMVSSLLGLPELCVTELRHALRCDDPAEKDYHIRQVLQACTPFLEQSD